MLIRPSVPNCPELLQRLLRSLFVEKVVSFAVIVSKLEKIAATPPPNGWRFPYDELVVFNGHSTPDDPRAQSPRHHTPNESDADVTDDEETDRVSRSLKRESRTPLTMKPSSRARSDSPSSPKPPPLPITTRPPQPSNIKTTKSSKNNHVSIKLPEPAVAAPTNLSPSTDREAASAFTSNTPTSDYHNIAPSAQISRDPLVADASTPLLTQKKDGNVADVSTPLLTQKKDNNIADASTPLLAQMKDSRK